MSKVVWGLYVEDEALTEQGNHAGHTDYKRDIG